MKTDDYDISDHWDNPNPNALLIWLLGVLRRLNKNEEECLKGRVVLLRLNSLSSTDILIWMVQIQWPKFQIECSKRE